MKPIRFNEVELAKIKEYLTEGATVELLAGFFEVNRATMASRVEALGIRGVGPKLKGFRMQLVLYYHLLQKEKETLDQYDQKLISQLADSVWQSMEFNEPLFKILFDAIRDDPFARLHRAIFGNFAAIHFREEFRLFVKQLSDWDVGPAELSCKFCNYLGLKLKQGNYAFPSLDEHDKAKFFEALNTLTPRENKILQMRCGFEGQSMGLQEIAKHFSVGRERIRQIEAKALRRLRHPSRSRKIYYLRSVSRKLEYLESEVARLTKLLNHYAPNAPREVLDGDKSLEAFQEERRDKKVIPLETPIEALELSVRAYNALKNLDLRTLGELLNKTEQELFQVRSFGRKSLLEIKELLDNSGYSLRQ